MRNMLKNLLISKRDLKQFQQKSLKKRQVKEQISEQLYLK